MGRRTPTRRRRDPTGPPTRGGRHARAAHKKGRSGGGKWDFPAGRQRANTSISFGARRIDSRRGQAIGRPSAPVIAAAAKNLAAPAKRGPSPGVADGRRTHPDRARARQSQRSADETLRLRPHREQKALSDSVAESMKATPAREARQSRSASRHARSCARQSRFDAISSRLSREGVGKHTHLTRSSDGRPEEHLQRLARCYCRTREMEGAHSDGTRRLGDGWRFTRVAAEGTPAKQCPKRDGWIRWAATAARDPAPRR